MSPCNEKEDDRGHEGKPAHHLVHQTQSNRDRDEANVIRRALFSIVAENYIEEQHK